MKNRMNEMKNIHKNEKIEMYEFHKKKQFQYYLKNLVFVILSIYR